MQTTTTQTLDVLLGEPADQNAAPRWLHTEMPAFDPEDQKPYVHAWLQRLAQGRPAPVPDKRQRGSQPTMTPFASTQIAQMLHSAAHDRVHGVRLAIEQDAFRKLRLDVDASNGRSMVVSLSTLHNTSRIETTHELNIPLALWHEVNPATQPSFAPDKIVELSDRTNDLDSDFLYLNAAAASAVFTYRDQTQDVPGLTGARLASMVSLVLSGAENAYLKLPTGRLRMDGEPVMGTAMLTAEGPNLQLTCHGFTAAGDALLPGDRSALRFSREAAEQLIADQRR